MQRLIALIATLSLALIYSAPHHAAADTLTIGTLNEGVREQLEIYQPLADYLEETLQDAGITEVRVTVLPSSRHMARALDNAEIDVFIDSALVAAKVSRWSSATPFMRNWKNGKNANHSVIVTHKNSGIKQLSDLKGKRIAFEEADSSTGFLMPAHILFSNGLKLREIKSPKTVISGDDVGYFFTANHKNSIYMLATGRVDAAATDPEGFKFLLEARPGEFHAIESSTSLPNQVLLVRDGLSSDVRAQLRNELSRMFSTVEGRAVLKVFNNSSGFDDFPNGVHDTFAPLYRIVDALKEAGLI